jgi:hypothetical protein
LPPRREQTGPAPGGDITAGEHVERSLILDLAPLDKAKWKAANLHFMQPTLDIRAGDFELRHLRHSTQVPPPVYWRCSECQRIGVLGWRRCGRM